MFAISQRFPKVTPFPDPQLLLLPHTGLHYSSDASSTGLSIPVIAHWDCFACPCPCTMAKGLYHGTQHACYIGITIRNG